MDSTKEDVKAIAERMAEARMPTNTFIGTHGMGARIGYAVCAEAILPHILSLMARAVHNSDLTAL